MPPKVLPTVATKIATQNRFGLSLTKPNNTGSVAIGNNVAEVKDTAKIAGNPTDETEKNSNK